MATTAVDPQRLAAVRRRYAEEANKRLKPEGFLAVLPILCAGNRVWGAQFAVRFIEDGIATADEIRLADSAGGLGGTWHWNRFPGLHCDVESDVYLPLLEETGYIPLQKYASGQEVRVHAELIGEKCGLVDKTLFRTDVEGAKWDDNAQLRTITVTEHHGPTEGLVKSTFRAECVYLAAGVLTRPQIPRIPGLPSSKGNLFHAARWNYAVSGGSQSSQRLTELEGKRVAIVGTAAMSIAVVPEFQTKVATGKGWQFKRLLNLNTFSANSAAPGLENLVNDAWTDMPAYSAIMGAPGVTDSSPQALERHTDAYHALNLPHMEAVRAGIDELANFSATYLQTINRPNVRLVDTNGKGPSRATVTGFVLRSTDSGERSLAACTGVNVIGKHGQLLDGKWRTKGAAALHGYATNGFSNLFFSGTSQATLTGNNVFMLGLIAQHIAHMVGEAERRVGRGQGKRAIVEVTLDGEEAHTAANVTDSEEKAKRARGVTWLEGTISFLDYIRRWRDEESLKGLSVVQAGEVRTCL
ncbi:hypothetical protein BDW68DRAFT_191984 [Aspergillus falconensis]